MSNGIMRIVDLLKSSYWSDRDKAMFALFALTEGRDRWLLRRIEKEAEKELSEMALWHSRSHAMLACVILGRIRGLSDQEIFDKWRDYRKTR